MPISLGSVDNLLTSVIPVNIKINGPLQTRVKMLPNAYRLKAMSVIPHTLLKIKYGVTHVHLHKATNFKLLLLNALLNARSFGLDVKYRCTQLRKRYREFRNARF
mmetsp:Transcript_3437/g.4234  ORF Transcript_3437/g.4234 Transcript_3437/m.4234 type:complete len:105 (-) Transcript_3437:530-844(-)